jgi:hypothetical protein
VITKVWIVYIYVCMYGTIYCIRAWILSFFGEHTLLIKEVTGYNKFYDDWVSNCKDRVTWIESYNGDNFLVYWIQHILWVHQYCGFINIVDSSILWVHQYCGFINTVGSSILWVHTFVYHIFIHFNIFSSILTKFIHFSFIFHPIYLHYIMSRK